MNVMLTIIGLVFLIIIMCFLFLDSPYIFYFHMPKCKRCGHIMEYKGLKEDAGEDFYLFHCHHCGAWKQIPKGVSLMCFLFKDYNPLNEQL